MNVPNKFYLCKILLTSSTVYMIDIKHLAMTTGNTTKAANMFIFQPEYGYLFIYLFIAPHCVVYLIHSVFIYAVKIPFINLQMSLGSIPNVHVPGAVHFRSTSTIHLFPSLELHFPTNYQNQRHSEAVGWHCLN